MKLGAVVVGFLLIASGPLAMPALRAFFTTVIVVLLTLAAVGLVGWFGWRFWQTHSGKGVIPDVRVLHYPEESGTNPPKPSPSAVPANDYRYQPRPTEVPPSQPTTPQPPPPQPQPENRAPTGDLTEQFRALDWFQFEKIVALIYRKLGDEVERRGGANADGGLDLLLRRNGLTLGVQCKHWKTWQVGVKSVREFLGALTAAGLKEGIFVSLGKFTPDAATLATRHGIQLVDARDLADLVDRAGVRADPEFLRALTNPDKYCPRCESRLVLRTATKGDNAGQQFWGCSTYPRCKYILRT